MVRNRGPADGNTALGSAILEAGCSHAALARKVNELGRAQGVVSRYDKASVTRWLSGMIPRGRAPEFIAAALAGFLGRPVSQVDLAFPTEPQRPVVAKALTYREDVAETLHILAELGSTDISRRSLLGTVPFVATALMDPQRQWLLWLLEEDQAPRLAAVAGGGPAQRADEESRWVGYLDHHYLEAEAALVHRDLGESAEAERLAEASVRANANRRRRQAISRSVLATALFQQNRLDEAVGTATRALDQLGDVHSERSVQALRDFRSRLAPRRTEALVRDFERKARPILGEAA